MRKPVWGKKIWLIRWFNRPKKFRLRVEVWGQLRSSVIYLSGSFIKTSFYTLLVKNVDQCSFKWYRHVAFTKVSPILKASFFLLCKTQMKSELSAVIIISDNFLKKKDKSSPPLIQRGIAVKEKTDSSRLWLSNIPANCILIFLMIKC